MSDGNIHVFRLRPMPGVPEGAKITVSEDEMTLFMILPDDSQLIFTADRAVFIRGRDVYMITQWQQPADWLNARPVERTAPMAVPRPVPSSHPGSYGVDGQRGVPYVA